MLDEFRNGLGFGLDPFQAEACSALDAGGSVLVAAPTGSGKTVVGEFAVYLALRQGRKAFYTVPIKALANQKFADLARSHGREKVGLLTGDAGINAGADVVVMTTEVLRTMLYTDAPALDRLGWVVVDEVHYLADPVRGAVWEEVILQLPRQVRLAALSATVSNAEQFGAWLAGVRGDTAVVVSEHRPVPLHQHVMVGNEILDLFAGPVAFDELDAASGPGGVPAGHQVNPELLALAAALGRRGGEDGGEPGRGRSRRFEREWAARRGGTGRAWPQLVQRLGREGLLPAVAFIFSRAGCEAALQECIDSGLWLTGPAERREILRQADDTVRDLPAEDLEAFGAGTWRDGLRRGFAAHHAGLLPAFKETAEQLFAAGLVKAVFATETLALGLNLPARSVVLDRLEKFNGLTRVALTPGEYTQLTGRAGRRGIDTEGHAVVRWQRGTDPAAVAHLASRRTYPLVSRFRPGYNMAANLLARWGRPGALRLLESSFARFQDPAAGFVAAFDGICAVLTRYGYLTGNRDEPVLAAGGQRLRAIHGERDLLLCLGLDHGAFEDLEPAELAALAGILAYQPRNAAGAGRPKMPTSALEAAADTVFGQWAGLLHLEETYALPGTAEPGFGLAGPLYRWARGAGLSAALAGTELAAGDFVHWAKRAADLLDQLARAEPGPADVAARCRQALGLVARGAVARSSVSGDSE
ncbi:DEAD/DEAH box helicase [Arthrobacter mobilis]|uniref:DEAD/DEAH box helicase n=2 Tax=Arthrobacter mobilis TaxID=2724944 RepID=A0A7X6QMJ9_9MICC|nr:DEAD/DEAH box helicase [Arthrobacter mobilis]